MENTAEKYMRSKIYKPGFASSKVIGWGLAGGLLATLIMDLLLMAAFTIAGQSALTCFTIVGDTMARFISLSGMEVQGGIPLGILTHYLIGPLFGAIFGALVSSNYVLKHMTYKKCLLSAVIFVEVFSQPMLAMAPLLMDMTSQDIWLWYGGSTIMHMIYGLVLGVFMGSRLRQ